jgi:hypothetical protein
MSIITVIFCIMRKRRFVRIRRFVCRKSATRIPDNVGNRAEC